MDRLRQPALTADKGRVRDPRSRGAVHLSDGLLANGQPVRHANRQKGRGPSSWLTRGHYLRTMTRHFLQAVTHAMRHLANKVAGPRGTQAIIYAARQSLDAIKAAREAVVATVKWSAMQTGKRASGQLVGRISSQIVLPTLRRSTAFCKFLNEDDYLGIPATTTGATCLTSTQPYV